MDDEPQNPEAIIEPLREQSARNEEMGFPHPVVHLAAAEAAVREGFAAGRAAATPDPPPCRCPDDWRYDDGSVSCPRHPTKPDAPAVSPDERLREAGDERPRQTYTITTLPGSGNERKTIVAGSLTEALDAVTRNIYGDPWSDGPNPWVLTFHIARGDVGEFDHAGAVARMKDDLALQEFHADRARLAAADREAPEEAHAPHGDRPAHERGGRA